MNDEILGHKKRCQNRTAVLGLYFVATYFVLLANTFFFLKTVPQAGTLTTMFAVDVFLIYSVFYLVPVFLVAGILNRVISCRPVQRVLQTHHLAWVGSGIVYGIAFIGFGFVQIYIYADKQIYQLYDYHINSFVWNLVFTRGGLESLGGGASSVVTYVLIILLFFALQGILLAGILWLPRLRTEYLRRWSRRKKIVVLFLLIFATLFQGITYGFSRFKGYAPVPIASHAFPFYVPVTFRHLALSLGWKENRTPGFHMKWSQSAGLAYPQTKIERIPNAPKYNLVWLVAESLRADMLDPEIMPATSLFSQQALTFTRHYSGGNGTRMALFSMFYGLYGNYWFSFLEQRRGPLLLDILLEDQYQMFIYTSAKFSYPEFDKTIFVRIPQSQLHESPTGPGWKLDRKNVTALLADVGHRNPAHPFFAFMFFESPHAKYYFPPESVIRQPYLEEFNYATVDFKKNMSLIKNRYINSCHHLDSQFQRIFAYLKEQDLLETTIVVVTGDHGEEFMEKGWWGHGSALTEEQLLVPLVLHVPGQPPRIIHDMSSHLDLPATILPYLGVANEAEDYSLGINLLGDKKRTYTIAGHWKKLAYIDDNYKALFPLGQYDFSQQQVTTGNDAKLQNPSDFFQNNQSQLVQVMKEMSRFTKRK